MKHMGLSRWRCDDDPVGAAEDYKPSVKAWSFSLQKNKSGFRLFM